MSQKKGLIKGRLASVFIIWWLIWGGFFGFLIFENLTDEGSVKAANIIVDWQGAGDYTTIQNAIDNAQPGDTIYVWAGEYQENVKVDKTVTVIGNGTSNTTINGKKTGDVVYISANWVNVSGFTINNSGSNWRDSGIEISNAQNCSIVNNNCSNNAFGIYIINSANNTIENNTGNFNSYLGIFIEQSPNNTILNNNCSNNGYYGLRSYYGDDSIIINNTFNSNNYLGLYLYYTSNNIIQNNICNFMQRFDGIGIYYSSNNNITNNTFNSNNRYGMYLYSSSNNNFINNQCNSNNVYGVYAYQANFNNITDCSFSNNSYGAFIFYSNSNQIINSSYNGNSQYGCYLYNSPYTFMKNCTFNSNENMGIYTTQCDYLTINNCTLNWNKYVGIRIDTSKFAELNNNTMLECGIIIEGNLLDHWNTHEINISNLVNYKPVYYLKNQTNKIIPKNIGQVILANCSKIIIKNSNYSKCSVGIEVGFSNNITITNISVFYNLYGIFIYQSNDNNISSCTCNSNYYYGYYIYYSDKNKLMNCNSSLNNLYGFYIYVTDQNTFFNCISKSNTNSGFYSYASDKNIFMNCKSNWNDGSGFYLISSELNKLINNTYNNNDNNGVLISQSTYTLIENCTFNWNKIHGVHDYYSRYLKLKNSTCNWNNDSGIYVDRDNENYFENNTINSNLVNGLYAVDSYNNRMLNCKIINNSVGINLTSGSYNWDIINTSISESNDSDLQLYQNSHATVLNCMMNWSKIFYQDSVSTLTVKWFVHVHVINGTGVPVSKANIVIKNVTSDITYLGMTDNFGWCRWIPCFEYIENQTGILSTFTPHNFSATKRGYEDAFAEPKPNINKTKVITIILPNDIIPPEPPTDLIFTAVGGSYINFTWTQIIIEDVYGYNIYINDTGSSTNFHLLNSTNKTYFNATGLAEETNYHFQIKSFDDVPLESTPIEGYNKTLDLTPPIPPSLIKFSAIGGTFLNLTWAKSISTDVQGYQVFVNDTGSTTTFHFLVNTTFNYFNHNGLVEETEYIYLVRAYDEVPHYSVNISLIATTLDITAPMPPSDLAVENIGGHELTLTWNPSPDSDVMGYHIHINSTGAGGSGPFKKLFTLPKSSTKVIIPGLLEETTYYFTIVAFDEVPNDSVYSEVVLGATRDITAPSAPTGLIATPISDSEIVLNWDANSEPDIAGYIIYMNSSEQSAWGEFHSIQKIIGTETEYTVTGLIEQVTYYFKIKASDEVPNNSSFSNMAYATVPDKTPPSIPSGVKVSNPTNNTLTISWKANPESDVIGYLLLRSKSLTDTFESIKAEPITTIFYIDTVLDENTTYYYRVRAIDDFGLKSGFSDIAIGTTLHGPLPPEINRSVENFEIVEDSYDDSSIDLFDWFKDLNGDELEFECKGNKNIDVWIYNKNGTVILKPLKNWNGFEVLTFIASDGVYNTTDAVTITVTPVNDPPEHAEIISPDNDIEIEFGTGLTFTGTCDDPDLPYGDKLTVKWYSDLSGTFGNKESLENIKLPIGNHLITMEVSDLGGEKAFANIRVHILESPEYDNDNDGMPDSWENSFGLNPDNPDDAKSDSDNDTLSNIDEYNNNTNPNEQDTDFDGLPDGLEILEFYTNPINPDTDNDTYSDGDEVLAGTNPLNSSDFPIKERKGKFKYSPGLNVFGIIISTLIIIIIFIILIAFLYVDKFRSTLSKLVTTPPPPTPYPLKKSLKKKTIRPKKMKLKEKRHEEEEWADEGEEWEDEEEEWEDEEDEWADEEEELADEEDEEWEDEEEGEWEDEAEDEWVEE